MIEEIAMAWAHAGLDVAFCLRRCALVTGEFAYDEQETRLQRRLKPKILNVKTIPVRHRSLAEVLDPQPRSLFFEAETNKLAHSCCCS